MDIADSLLIYDAGINGLKEKTRCSLRFDHPAQLVSLLQENQVKKIICGGCPQFLARMLASHGFKLAVGLTGTPSKGSNPVIRNLIPILR